MASGVTQVHSFETMSEFEVVRDQRAGWAESDESDVELSARFERDAVPM